jgi:hypothetical protein
MRRVIIIVCIAAVVGLGLAGLALGDAKNTTTNAPPQAPQAPQAAVPNVQVPVAAGPVTASQCVPCHGSNYDNFKNPILYFKHDPHLIRGIRCAACHSEFPHAPGGINRPSMTVCYNCHGLGHSGQGPVASGECSFCHPTGYGVPATHTPDFRNSGHKAEAGKDPFPCETCHKTDFCADCHTARLVKPKNHGDAAKWRKLHGTKRDKGGCEVCHKESEFCVRCHITPMPHPAQWLGSHKETARATKYDCKICHQSRQECSDCHHQFKPTTMLNQDTCTACHEDYKRQLFELIWVDQKPSRSKGIIVHKAHFQMTNTQPFACEECHQREYVTAKGCFSFELCYTCHGRERGGSLIAKWGGQELCYRCHTRKQ